MNWTRVAVSSAATVVIVGLAACHSAEKTATRSQPAGSYAGAPATAPVYRPAPNGMTPVGTFNPSIDLNASLSEGDFSNFPGRALGLAGVPQLDLQAVLDGNRGSVGGQSPFVDAAHHIRSPARFKLEVQSGTPGAEAAPPTVFAPAGNMSISLRPGQELLIIERPAAADRYARPDRDDFPGSGTLMTRWSEQGQPEREVPVPLKHTDVKASITGPISSVRVTQQFHNPYASKIEAVYVFPLPDDAAVNDFVMTIGSRSIRGVIREREQAQQIYTQAKAQGYHASLMTQERSNIFTQHVANIQPGEQVDIAITYFGALGYHEGAYEFVFPMVVGPRYNPASTKSGSGWGQGTGVGAAQAYGAPTGQSTDVQYLRPHTRSGSDISVSVDVNAGVRLEGVESPTHQISVTTGPTAERATVTLSPSDSIPNRDFVLRYRVAGGEVRAGMITARDEKTGDNYFTMVVVPPADLSYCPRGPMELIFVIDASGSMDGAHLDLAKRCVRNALGQMRPMDSLQLIRFSDKAEFLTAAPVAATPDNLARADAYVANLRAGGGTEMLNGLEPALEARGEWRRSRYICLLSDGLLGNEPEVLGQLKKKLGDSRVFSVAIGSAPNRALMNSIARLGRGVSTWVGSPDDADQAMSLFAQRIGNAPMTNLSLDFGNLNARDVYPSKLPDLYVGRPIVITGRFKGNANPGASVKITGRAGEERQTITVPVLWSDPDQSKALPLVWARARITDLDEESSWRRSPGAGSVQGPNRSEIQDLSLKYGIMSAYTSFVAVDCSQRTGGTYGTTVQVPVPIPAGTRYETTVGER